MDGESEQSARLERERVLDMHARLAPYRERAFAVVGVTLAASGFWLGFWPIALLAVLFVAFRMVDGVTHRSPHPGRWAAATWAMSAFFIALIAALTGGVESPVAPALVLPIATLGARFDERGVIIGVAYVVALLLVATVAVDPGAVADQPDRLFILVGLVLAMAFLTAATVRSERDHRREAALDPLTGLLNRHALIQRLTDYERGAAAGSRIGVLVGDLDHFKRINDEHGHLTGDAVLKDVAEALRGALRTMDLVYRIGGEEFVVVLPGADLDRARGVAERLRETVDSSVGGFELTISFGAAAGEAGAFTDLYRRADAALFAAKRAGRDRVAVAA